MARVRNCMVALKRKDRGNKTRRGYDSAYIRLWRRGTLGLSAGAWFSTATHYMGSVHGISPLLLAGHCRLRDWLHVPGLGPPRQQRDRSSTVPPAGPALVPSGSFGGRRGFRPQAPLREVG